MTNRKDEHVSLALDSFKEEKNSDFDRVKIVYNSLTSTDFNEVDLSTEFCGIKFETPFYINAMTGGSDKTLEINKQLARVAKSTGIAIASGSISAALKDESKIPSFKIMREINSNGIIMANIGAEYSLTDARRAVEILDADILQIHINLIQELVMPEGDRSFKTWVHNIEDIVKNIGIPVIVKEVGFGMSEKTIQTLKSIGVQTIDVSGAGGTNFVTIENSRRDNKEFDYLEDFGISTLDSLINSTNYQNDIEILASGGVRNPLDILKSLILGAKGVGISGLILNTLMTKGEEETISLVNRYKQELKTLMVLVDCKNVKELKFVEFNIK